MEKYEPIMKFVLNDYCLGFAELKDNCWNYSIFSTDPNVKDIFMKEYYAGYVQGKLQGTHAIMAARNNAWNNTFLCDTSAPEHKFPQNFDPSKEELKKAARCLQENYQYLYNWIKKEELSTVEETKRIARNIKRLLFRMLGIYDGVTYNVPQRDTTFERIDPKRMNSLKLELRYGIQALSFMDIYFINAQSDLFDALTSSKESYRGLHKTDHCSAFLKRVNGDIFWTHNTWAGFLCQSHTISYVVGDDFITQNSYCPGQFGSNMDFGFNGNGICFNETTHRNSYTEPKTAGIWICWRAAAAEMFAKNIDDFYRHITIDNTGTYLNGYMLIDTTNGETALLEMSYKRFVLFRSDGGEYEVTDSIAGKMGKSDYNTELLTPEYIFGVNYPISYNVAKDLESTDNRPMRRIQFKAHIGEVENMETARNLITYTEPGEPLSIFGRWDLGYGTTKFPKTIPDGSVDAKAYSANEVKDLLGRICLSPDEKGTETSFWMLYGTPKIEGKPFVWNSSEWYTKYQIRLNYVPNVLTGAWNPTRLFMKSK